ncbi:MAG: alpha/beta fold hydrolase [Acidobacteria bacterium]|nr:alpha/beta fold hydrolase [Acidobacteriota bacterium]
MAIIPLLAGCVSLKPYDRAIAALDGGDFIQIAGDRVHVQVSGQGEPVLLVHGFGGSTYSWRDVAPTLARHFQVIAVDLYGFGYTERPESLERYTRAGQLDLLLGVLDALGIERAQVVGHSYGGGLAMTLAARHPERVSSLVLVDSTAPSYADKRRKLVAALPPVTYAFTRGYALRPASIRRALEHAWYDDDAITPDMVHQYLDRLKIEGASRAYRGLTTPLVEDPDTKPVEYEDLDLPILVVWGADDQLISVADGRAAAERMPRSRFVAIDDCGHAPMEEQPREFLDAVLPFLEQPASAIAR